MTEIGISEYATTAHAIGIIATLFVVLYYSRKQMKSLSIDLETKILNDLDINFVRLTSMVMEKPQLMKVVAKELNPSPDIAFSYHILYTFAHAFHMHQRKVVSDNEWDGWIRWIKSAFEHGTISEIWKKEIELENGLIQHFKTLLIKK